MATHIKDILNNISNIYATDTTINTLMGFEEVLDDIDLYAYANWLDGELVEGPVYKRYFVKCTFMWPYKKMPDPSGAKRLLAQGCEVVYNKDYLKFPVSVKDPDDYESGTHFPKTARTKIWLVSITIPKQLINAVEQSSADLENEQSDFENIDAAFDQDTEPMQEQGADDMGGMDANLGIPQ